MKKKFGLFLPISTAVIALIGCNKQPATYKVTFDLMGGTGVSKTVVEVKEGEKVAKPEETPTKTGYTFNGWYKEPSGSEVFDFDNAVIKANTTIYAHYDEIYTIKFDLMGGTGITQTEIKVKAGEKVTKPKEVPTKTGYTFDNWYKTPTGEDKFDFDTPINANTTIYAHYTINKYIVKFNTLGGTEYADQSIEYGKTIDTTKIGEPTKTGYKFLNWQKNGEDFNLTTPIVENTVLVAKYAANEYTVTFKINPEELDFLVPNPSKIAPQTVAFGEHVQRPNDPIDEGTPTASGQTKYKFVGWYKEYSKTGGYSKLYDFTSTMEDSDLTLYAKWDNQHHVAAFNYGKISSEQEIWEYQLVTKGEQVMPPEEKQKKGEHIDHWETENGTTVTFPCNITEHTIYVAIWKANEYTVTFDTDGGKEKIEPQTIQYGKTVKKPANPTKDGHSFKEWVDESGAKFDFESPVYRDITLKATWEINKYTVSFDLNFPIEDPKKPVVDPVDPITVPYGSTLGNKLPVLKDTSEYFQFGGWYIDKEYKEKFTPFTPVEKDTLLYAKWDRDAYVITLDYGKDPETQEEIIYQETVQKGAQYNPGEPTYKSHDFLGWFNQKEGGEKISTPITVNNDLTIYAHWEIKQLVVSFEDVSGTKVSDPVKVVYGGTVSRPTDPSPKGDMIFIDWYNYDLKDKFDFENTKIVADTKIIAQFGYTVTFDTTGLVEGTKIEPQKIVKNFCATNPGYPKAADSGKNMYAWLDKNGKEYNFNSPITENITLYPGFADKELTMLGSNNIDIDSAGYKYTVLADGSIIIPDEDITFGVLPEYQHIIKYDETNRKFKAVGGLNGGKAVIYAYVLYNDNYYYQTKEVSVGSFSKLKADSLANGIVEAKNNSVAGDVVIPTVYYTSGSQAVKITEIKNSAFIDCTNLQRVYIPNTITRIEDDAFRTFDRWSYAANGNLNTVVFEENSTLEYIGVAAFDGQTKLSSIKIPASVTTICAGAFYDTIKSVEFEDKDSTWHLVPTSISVTPEVDEYNISQFTPEQIANDLKIPSYDNQSYHADFHWYKNILK